MPSITGTFDVTITPETLSDTAARSGLGRLSLDKRYHGALEASAQGEMLSARASVTGSAGYVALERVEGNLDGRHGSFYLQHSGTMTRGVPALSVTVVPIRERSSCKDSGAAWPSASRTASIIMILRMTLLRRNELGYRQGCLDRVCRHQRGGDGLCAHFRLGPGQGGLHRAGPEVGHSGGEHRTGLPPAGQMMAP